MSKLHTRFHARKRSVSYEAILGLKLGYCLCVLLFLFARFWFPFARQVTCPVTITPPIQEPESCVGVRKVECVSNEITFLLSWYAIWTPVFFLPSFVPNLVTLDTGFRASVSSSFSLRRIGQKIFIILLLSDIFLHKLNNDICGTWLDMRKWDDEETSLGNLALGRNKYAHRILREKGFFYANSLTMAARREAFM